MKNSKIDKEKIIANLSDILRENAFTVHQETNSTDRGEHTTITANHPNDPEHTHTLELLENSNGTIKVITHNEIDNLPGFIPSKEAIVDNEESIATIMASWVRETIVDTIMNNPPIPMW